MGKGRKWLQPHPIEQELAPKVNHAAPGIFHLAISSRREHALLDVVGDLRAEIVLDFRLDAIFIHRINYARLDLISAQILFVALVKLPKRLIGPLPINPELRRQF